MGTGRQRAKVIFEFIKRDGKFHWRARSSNGRVICTSSAMLHKQAPEKTVVNMVECIKLNQYKLVDGYVDD